MLTTFTLSYSQSKRTFHWYFGEKAGIDFSSGIGILDTNNAIYSQEACSVISDTLGNLLFYTNGPNVWDRTHQLMPNGNGLMGCISASQGSLIVPKPGSNSIYYIFTISWGCTDTIGALRYSIIDMTLNGGFGDVASKNIFLFSPVNEQLNAVHHCNGKDIWVTSHQLHSNKFYSYLVTNAGIDTIPVISAIGSIYPSFYPNCVTAGELKFSPNGKKLATAGGTCSYAFHIAELFDFNNQSGIISNCISLPSDSFCYGVSFSPDNSKLYYTYNGLTVGGGIIQYDLTIPSASAIINSKTQIFYTTNNFLAGIQLSSNYKIYVSRFWRDTLGIIQNPNVLGINCNYINNGLFLNGKKCREAFPNYIESLFSEKPDTCENIGITTNEFHVPKIKAYPNPFNQRSILEFENLNNERNTLTLFDNKGCLVRTISDITTDKIEIERKDLTNGLYFFQLRSEKQIIGSGKLMIE